VSLAAIADDGDLLTLDQIEIGIPIVIDTHTNFPALMSPGYGSAAFVPSDQPNSKW
jgi:hypothetical protein